MTINQLIEKLNEIGVSGDEQICVGACGGLGAHGKEIDIVSRGFDFDTGKILLHPKQPLILMKKPGQPKPRGGN